jgi:hypothetical protein
MMEEKSLYWLAGLLEGEGSFLCGPPSSPHCPIVTCSMTDEDVILRLANLWGVSYCRVGEKRGAARGWKAAWTARLHGQRAVDLMKAIRPLMSRRRQEQIDKAISSHRPKGYMRRKVSDEQASEIVKRFRDGESAQELAEEFGITRWTVYDLNKGRYRHAA